jgi:hypothetical protein
MELENDTVDELNATIIARDATPVLEMEQLPVHYRNKIILTIQDSDVKKAKFGPRGRSPSPKPYFTIDKTDFPECCRQPWAEAKSLTGKVAFLSVLVKNISRASIKGEVPVQFKTVLAPTFGQNLTK